MKERMFRVALIALVSITAFMVSFCDFNGVYFVVGIPLVVALFFYKTRYFVCGCAGMLVASFFISTTSLPIIVVTTTIFTYLLSMLLSKFKLPLRRMLAIIGAFYGFSLSWMCHFSPFHTPLLNLILIPSICYILCYMIIDIQIDLKSKEKFSLTKRQLIFYGLLLNIVLYRLETLNLNFRLGFTLVLILNYLLIKVDKYVGMIVYLACLIFNFQHSSQMEIVFALIPLIFAIKQLSQNKYFGTFIYLTINICFLMYFKDNFYMDEVLVVTAFMLLLPEKIFTHIAVYIVEPKDYEIKLFQESYYHCLNRNKKIQNIAMYLEHHIKTTTKLKKYSKDVIYDDMQFLTMKLKEEEDIHYKDNIIQAFRFRRAPVLALTITKDYLNNYNVFLQLEENTLSEKDIIEILEDNLKVKLKINYRFYHKILGFYCYNFVNGDERKFNLSIKQRSKENSCGDSYLTFNTKTKKYFLVSDGMGHGAKANKESSSALLMLKNFIELGMEPEKAIISCNALIMSPDEDRFNTLDLLEYDIFDDKLYLYKNGSGITYLKSEDKVDKISSENLPLGIVENIKIDKISLDFETGYIILTSDGIRKDLTQLLKEIEVKNANALSNEILSYEGKNISDDQTIIVINVIKNS